MRSFRGLAIGAVVVAVLSGCNSEDTAAAPPDSSPSRSESVSASPSPSTAPPPTPPAGASEHSDRGAIAFAKHFVDVVNYTTSTGVAHELKRVSTAGCQSCRNIIKVTEETYANGGYIRGGRWAVESVSVFRPDRNERRIITLSVSTAAQRYRPSASEPEERIQPGDNTVNVYLSPRGRSWAVTRMDVVT